MDNASANASGIPVTADAPSVALQRFVASGALAGAVLLVADAEGVRSHGAVGFADLAARAPMKPDSFFWIASMSKPMTSAAVLMLVDEGRLSLDDPLEKHLPEFAGQWLAVERDAERELLRKPARPATVRDALSHMSGLPFMSRPERGLIDTLSLREASLSYALTALDAEPGARYAYSNAGINAVGRVIEVVSGKPYAEFMDERLLKPLGMTETTFWPTAAQLARLAKTYRANEAKTALSEVPVPQFTYPLDDRRRHPSPAGGYFSTATDMARFGRMLLRDGDLDGRRYLSVAAAHEMRRRQTPASGASHGLGLGLDEPANGFGHGGALSTNLWIDPRLGRVFVYLVQHQGYAGPDGDAIMPAFRAAAG